MTSVDEARPGGAQPRMPDEREPTAGLDRLDPIAANLSRPAKRRGRVLVVFGVGWLVLITLLAVTAEWLPLADYASARLTPRERPALSFDEPLGTDELGRSTLSRTIYGARVSLAVGIGASALGIVVGGLAGMLAGYFRGKLEAVVNVLLNTALAFPPIILLLAITAVMTQSFVTLVVALSLISIPPFARLARASTLSYASREFVVAARSLGAGHLRILFRELLPNVLLPVLSYAFIVIATMIVAEGSLSFLGYGIPPPQPSWGGMIATGRSSLATDPHLVFVPAVVLLLTVFSFNVVGDHARRAVDARSSVL